MDVHRRSVLLGLYAAGVTGGLAFGTGAFASVESERDIEVQISSDEPDEGVVAIFDQQDRFVEYDDSDNAEFVITGEQLENADGLNPDAFTAFEDVLRLRIESGNRGPYTVIFDDEDDSAQGLQFTLNEAESDGTPDSSDSYPLELEDINVGQEAVLDIEIDTDPDDENGTITGKLSIRITSQED